MTTDQRDFFPSGTGSVLARSVSAEVRARLAAQRLTQRELASGAGFTSHNYVSIRLRDEKPFTLDDVERLVRFFEDGIEDYHDFIEKALDNHRERLWIELDDARRSRPAALSVVDDSVGDSIAAHEEEGSIGGEQEERHEP